MPNPEPTPPEPDWDLLVDDVTARIAAVRTCWQATERDRPALHPAMARDIYLPALRLLAEFCLAIEIEEETNDGR